MIYMEIPMNTEKHAGICKKQQNHLGKKHQMSAINMVIRAMNMACGYVPVCYII